MIPSCWTSNSLSSWMILRTLIKCKPSLCSNSKLRSAADKGLLPWVCCLPLLQLLVHNQSSAERSGLGRCPWPSMGLLALDQVQQSGAIHIACVLCMWLEISRCAPSTWRHCFCRTYSTKRNYIQQEISRRSWYSIHTNPWLCSWVYSSHQGCLQSAVVNTHRQCLPLLAPRCRSGDPAFLCVVSAHSLCHPWCPAVVPPGGLMTVWQVYLPRHHHAS